jgi:YVTN family beta-propeller protein
MWHPSSRRSLLAAAAFLGLAAPGAGALAAGGPAYHVAGHIAGPDGGWDYATFDPESRRIYVARGSAVMAVDADSGAVTPSVTSAVRAHSPVPLPGGRLLVTNGGSNTAVIVDARSGKALATLPTGENPDGAIYDPKSGLAFVMAHAGGEVTFVDVARMAVTATFPVGSKLEFAAVDGAGRLWVNDEMTSEVIAVDIAGRKVLAHYKLDGCEGPTGLAYAPDADRLVASCDKVAAVIDPASGRTVDKLKVGDGPDAVIYDPVRKRLLVPAGESGELTVIDASGPRLKVVQTVKTAIGARTGTVDPETGKVYLPTARMSPAAAGAKRPQPQSGTFELLVVAP